MLTAATVSSAKLALKAYKISDGRGLHLQVMTNGSRLWRLKYRVDVDGRRADKLLTIGPYPGSECEGVPECSAEVRDVMPSAVGELGRFSGVRLLKLRHAAPGELRGPVVAGATRPVGGGRAWPRSRGAPIEWRSVSSASKNGLTS